MIDRAVVEDMGLCHSAVVPTASSPAKKRSTAEINGLVESGPRNFDSDAESLCSPKRNNQWQEVEKPQLTIVPVTAPSRDFKVDESESANVESVDEKKTSNLLRQWLDEVVGLNPNRDIRRKFDVKEQIGTGSSCTFFFVEIVRRYITLRQTPHRHCVQSIGLGDKHICGMQTY